MDFEAVVDVSSKVKLTGADAGEASAKPTLGRRGRPKKAQTKDEAGAIDAEPLEANMIPMLRPKKSETNQRPTKADAEIEAAVNPTAVHRDRPRKSDINHDADSNVKGTASIDIDSNVAKPARKSRGRHRKSDAKIDSDVELGLASTSFDDGLDVPDVSAKPASSSGRPRKSNVKRVAVTGEAEADVDISFDLSSDVVVKPAPKPRGRPRKPDVNNEADDTNADSSFKTTVHSAPGRIRGRPKKDAEPAKSAPADQPSDQPRKSEVDSIDGSMDIDKPINGDESYPTNPDPSVWMDSAVDDVSLSGPSPIIKAPALQDFVGEYQVTCRTLKENWPEEIDQLNLDISVATDGDEMLAASFDFGVIEGTMRLALSEKKLNRFIQRQEHHEQSEFVVSDILDDKENDDDITESSLYSPLTGTGSASATEQDGNEITSNGKRKATDPAPGQQNRKSKIAKALPRIYFTNRGRWHEMTMT
ncbi:hypothetical protein B0H63DRAFT_448289 [Podospora didyma]|uniref:Uncharacterized protein n=1 Tax=Podospora didyma TaxID=330526 RepID=A0AAE0U1D5_9PEZI|nr:hypothetical protein B0H63DRAFT_448289 [Podospora didyma]